MSSDLEKKAANPSTLSMEYEAMLPRWQIINDVLGGTERMRAAGEVYLPRHAAESHQAFSERLGRAVLLNMTQFTLDGLVSRVFSEPVSISEDTTEKVTTWLDDIDLQGNNITVFAREAFDTGLAKGFAAILVEFPRTSAVPRTAADDTREQLRPYWVNIPPENIISMAISTENGKEVIEHVRIMEEVVDRIGFAQVVRRQIRVLDRHVHPAFVPAPYDSMVRGMDVDISGEAGTYFSRRDPFVLLTIYSEDTSKKEDDPERWVVSDVSVLDIPVITMAVYYAERDGVLLCKPPLTDLAYLNIAHWQSSADQTAILTTTRFPILASSGMVDEKKVVVGPHNWLNVQEANGRWYYVEHSGNSINAGREHMNDLIEQMSAYGAQFLTKRTGNTTATARALDSAEATAPLEDYAVRFSDTLNLAMYYTALWSKMPDGYAGALSVEADLSPLSMQAGSLQELGNARRHGDLSRSSYLSELVRMGVLAESFDEDTNLQQLDEERAEFSDGAARTDLDPGGGDTPTDPPADPVDPVEPAQNGA